MEAPLKRGLIDICVLAALRDEDSSGYRIIKTVKPYIEISESTLYPVLRRLEEAKLLSVRSVEHNGRLRKYYHISQAGIDRLDAFSEEWKEISAIYHFVTKEANHE